MRSRLGALLVAVACACGDAPAPVGDGETGGGTPVSRSPPELAPIARVETTDAWLDLIAQRPSAVILREGRLVIDLGRENARKHLALRPAAAWRLAQTVDGRRAGVVAGRTASIDVPFDGEVSPALHPDTEEHAGMALAIDLRALAPKQSMTVLLNEHPLAHMRVNERWARRTVSLPAEHLRPGDNRLRLHFRRTKADGDGEAAAAVGTVEVGPYDRITEGTHDRSMLPYEVRTDAPGGARLWIPAGGGLAYHVVAPRRGRLEIAARGRGSIEVLASVDADHRDGVRPRQILQEALAPTERKRQVDLSAWGGAPLRLEVRVGGTADDAGAELSALRLLARRSVPVDRRKRGLADVYVVAVEGARADELLDVARRPRLENLDALAREALVFERAYAVGAAAVPSHAALMSSVAPPRHLTIAGTFVAEGQTLLAEVLDRAGYGTALISANDYVSSERGLLQGLDRNLVMSRNDDEDARAILRRGLGLLPAAPGRRFLYVNLNDPQAPYDPPRELYGRREAPEGVPLPHHTHIWVGRIRLGKSAPGAEEIEYVRSLYRGEMQAVDAAVGNLVTRLREQERLDDSIVVLVGVHGEEFVEHGSAGHGHTLYEESIHVPLAIRAPKLLAPGRVGVPVDLLDLGPTLVDLLGLPFPDGWQGESLVPVIDDPQPPPRLVVSYLGDGSRVGIVGDHKLVVGPGRAERFFDLARDPGETGDRLEQGGIALRLVRTALAWQLTHAERWRRPRWGTGAGLRPAFALDLGM